MAKIIFYHQPYTQANGEPTHSKHDFDYITWPSVFAPWMLQTFKDHIWTQLGLGYIVKQIYDKHKAIWWARINAWEVMTRDNFIKQQDIVHLDYKHKKRSWHLHKNPTISLCIWAFNHPNDVFYFQDASGVNLGFMSHSQ
jgi:hypothetical protein